jgi:hypothetical protein
MTSAAPAGPAPKEGVAARPADAAVCEQRRRILASPAFAVTKRLKQFLAYVVEETLEGRAERIKAYSIATDVFGRPASFDAHSDPIVRVEASHLRQALERYYLTDGAADPILITIPKGSYQPCFAPREVAPPPALDAGQRWPRRTAVIVIACIVAAASAVAGALYVSRPAPPAATDLPYLAVVPFKLLSDSDGAATAADSFTQSVIGELAR